ncbi:hypothetical protein K488DRAFT_72508 [Vararia minispora EC-137]|uniref:Uncharacterized protein n=1 Tax=Vararia minispora EC-137 TaxID=1314806 RepID=A0ACB8QE08_9AGAM|nr:hypothetical protein K488DRAFT_72508 [Vararia minispora EC-137]
MDRLPTEMLVNITRDLTAEDLRQLRAANKRLKEIASPAAFSVVKVTNTFRSVQGLLQLLNSKAISGTIEVIEFVEDRDLGLASAALHPLPSLQFLNIQNLLAFSSPSWTHMSPLLERLHSLNIYVLTDDSECSFYAEGLTEFYDVFSEIILPACRSLRNLSLNSTCMVGIMPPLDFRRVNHPYLTTLSLSSVAFAWNEEDSPFGGAEDFIVRHAATLKSLELIGCGLVITEMAREPMQYWASIWARFTETLTSLTFLRVKFDEREEPAQDGARKEIRYFSEDTEYGLLRHQEDLEGEEDDVPALEAFKAIVDSRRESEQKQSSLV